jgi:hypothetical protein
MPDFFPETNINVMRAGGYETRPQETQLDHYAWMRQGPDVNDAVVLNRPIDPAVIPGNCSQRYLPRGRIFSLTANGTMVPGVLDEHPIPIACMLIGSHANDGDVVGGPRVGDPETHREAQVPFKLEANAGFWSLGAGYIYETSEFDPSHVTALVPTTPVTAVHDMTDFDKAGLIVPGTVYVDHIIGTVTERPEPCGINSVILTVKILGSVIPRMTADTPANLRP